MKAIENVMWNLYEQLNDLNERELNTLADIISIHYPQDELMLKAVKNKLKDNKNE